MTLPEARERALALKGRLGTLLGKGWFVVLVVFSCVYVLSYAVLERSAHYRRAVDFYGNSARSWVELGSLKFTPEGWQAFMGTAYHPVVFAVLAVPAILLSALAVSALAVLLLGLISSARDRRAEERRQRELRAFELDRQRIDADKRRPIVVGGAGGGGGGAVRRLCAVCDSDVDGSGAGCPNCGASWVQS